MAPSTADLLVDILAVSGVERIYGVPGDSLNGLTDAIRRHDAIAWQHVRHEEGAAFAAAGEAAVTGRLAVCAGSCGPGNLHLINGLYDAHRSRVPVLAIAAQIPRLEIGSQYFQETHPEALFAECSVYCQTAMVAEQLPRMLRIAMRAALEQRGVAVLVVPGDLFLKSAPTSPKPAPVLATSSVIRPDDAALDRAAGVLDAADRVTILAGAGCEGAHDELVALAGALRAPVVHALRGKDFVEYDNPYDVGLTGLIGFSSGYRAMEHCDCLLMLGTDFPYQQFYPQSVPVIQVDVRGENIGRRVPVDVALVGTVKDTASALLPKLRARTDSTHLDQMTEHYGRARRRLDKLASADRDRSPLHPQFVAATIDRLAGPDTIFTVDVGSPTVWAARYLRMNGRRRLLGSFNHGTMANALPQAVGAQAASPGRQVVALCGDGGLAMMLGELLTLRQNQLPVKLVVFDNSALGFVELEMKAAGLVNFATELVNPDFAAVAEATGLYGVSVQRPSELEDALMSAFAHDGPALVNVRIARQELSLPPKITLEQMRGFTLYAARTVLSGRGDEVIELAKTNLRELHHGDLL